MRKIVNMFSNGRINSLLCCGTAALLSACGGGNSSTGQKDNPVLLAMTVSGAANAPIVTFSPQVLDFGVVAVGTSSSVKTVTISNTGTANLSFPSDFQVGDGRFSFGGAGNCATNVAYAPGASCTASLVYTPTSTGAAAGSMSVTSNASATPAILSLKAGTVTTPAPVVTFSPAVLDFGVVAVGTSSAVKVVTISNTGNAPLSFPSDFQVADSRFAFGGAGTCATSVNYAPGASCTASLVYTPTSTGAVTGSMTISSNASTTPKVLSLKAGSGSTVTSPYNLYVATTGSDTNAGTSASPFKTISKAATMAKPGYLVHVADGTYRENVVTSSSGTASSLITYISDNKWGAKIVAPGTGTTAAWHNRGDYVAIIGFDISGGGAVGINHSGSGDIANQNHVHHIPAAACDGYGGTGIGFDQYNIKSGGTADANLVHDIGPLGTNCFRVQGVYTSIPNVTISNNVIYKVVGYAVTNGHCSYNVKVLNNTMFNNGGTAEGGAVVMTGNTNCSLASKGNVVANNIVYDNVIGLHEEGVSAADVTTYTNNLVFGNKINWGSMRMPHSNDVSADPAFVSYIKAGGGDYRLKVGSPAIGKGSATYGAPNDYLGKVRGSTVDIGAYEF